MKTYFSSHLVVVDQFLQLISMHHNMETAHLGQPELLSIHTSKAHLFPSAGAVGLASTIHSSLVLAKVHKSGSQATKVGDVVVKQLGSFIHFLIIATVANLHIRKIKQTNNMKNGYYSK